MKDSKQAPPQPKRSPAQEARTPRKDPGTPRHAGGNPWLTQQNRKILGKHYASKFGKR